MSLLAAVAAGLALLLARPPDRWRTRSRLRLPIDVTRRPATGALVLGVAVVGAPVLAGQPGPRIVLVLTVGGAAVFAAGQLRASRRRALVRRRRLDVADLLGLMSAELRAGVLPAHVLGGLAADFPHLRPAARAAELGGDVPTALRSAAGDPGRELLADLAGAWHVAERAGAPLAKVLDRLEAGSRSEREIEREVESGLAPARATGRLMAVLPAFGLLLGSGMGGDPLAVLTGTWVGVLCLAAGTALACAGVAWVERIATSLERDL